MKCKLMILGFLIFLSGCTKYGPWFHKQFKVAGSMADSCDVRELRLARKMLRREPVYQPFSWKTVDIVYAIPMNKLVTKVHDQLLCCGKSDKNDSAEVKSQKITKLQTRFYVLMDGGKLDWCYTLSVPGLGVFKASTVKTRELDRGMKGLLGEVNTQFKKNIYELYFDVVAGNRPCDLVVSNGSYTSTLSWEHFE